MKIQEEFVVSAPRPKVWDFFHDVPAVVQCLPGAELDDQVNDHTYRGRLSARLGPISTSFEGKATVLFDDQAWRVTVDGTGVDRRGGSRGQVAIACDITTVSDGAKVNVEADMQLSGTAAQFGRTGLIDEISRRLLRDFVTCLETKISAEPELAATIAAPPPRGFTLLLQSLWARLTRLFGRTRFGSAKRDRP